MKLSLENLCINRASNQIIDGFACSLANGEALVITGPNGVGKSTLLRAIAGLLAISFGTIHLELDTGETLDGQYVREYCHYLGHKNGLKPSLTAAENLRFWQQFCGNPVFSSGKALDKVGLNHVLDTPIGYLSAGQKRRVAIARLLVARKPIWILDEPTTGLDDNSAKLFSDIANGHCKSGGILIAATHQTLSLANARKVELQPVDKGAFA